MNIKIIVFTIVLLAQACAAHCAVQSEFYARISPIKGRPNLSMLSGAILLKNDGTSSIKIPTGGGELGSVYSSSYSPKAKISYSVGIKRLPDGRPIIPSETALSIVSLAPNEWARVDFELMVSRDLKIADIVVQFKVDKELAERFGTWAGVVEALPVLQ